MGLTPDQETAQAKIHDLLSELASIIGPSFGGDADGDLDPEDAPEGAVFLNEWVTVLSWTDETGKCFTTRLGSPSLLAHHRVGLLHEGLYGFADYG